MMAHFTAVRVGILSGDPVVGKAKSVQQTTDRAGAAPAPEPTLDVDCGPDGRGQLRPPLTRATNTGHVHRAVVRVDPSLAIGNPAAGTISPGKRTKLSRT